MVFIVGVNERQYQSPEQLGFSLKVGCALDGKSLSFCIMDTRVYNNFDEFNLELTHFPVL